MLRILTLILLTGLFLAGCGNTAPATTAPPPNTDQLTMTVYKSPTWGCCGDWVSYMEQNGVTVIKEDVDNLGPIKSRYQVPAELQSCHTAIVDGYVIEGHVPFAEVKRLLTERPNVIGLAVAGMPLGSPGMDAAGMTPQPYEVIAFGKEGQRDVFARYPQK